jgi:hypothetical protein
MSGPKAMSLKAIRKYVPEMRRKGVSVVARSPRGFLTAYARAGGRMSKLTEWWRNRRLGFIKRHMAQVRKHGEKLWKGGKPSRRALALIAWAYMPRVGK